MRTVKHKDFTRACGKVLLYAAVLFNALTWPAKDALSFALKNRDANACQRQGFKILLGLSNNSTHLNMEQQKSTVFAYYTLQMSTFSNVEKVELLDGTVKTIEEIKSLKNDFLYDALTKKSYNFKYKNYQLNHKIVFASKEYIVLRVANFKTIKAEKEFHEVYYDNEPSIMVIFQNIPNKQMIAIEKAPEVFSSVDAVAEFLEKGLTFILHEYNLKPHIRNIFDEQEFWSLISNYTNRIKFIRFEFVKENNDELYRTISEDLVDWSSSVNSHKTVVQITAPDDGVLEKINQDNKQLNGMIHSASLGTSPIKVKIAGMKSTISTKGKTITKEFKNIELESRDNKDIVYLLKSFFKDAQ